MSISKIKVNRQITKLPVMTIPYNVGLKKMSNNLLEKLEGRLVEIKDNLFDINNLISYDELFTNNIMFDEDDLINDNINKDDRDSNDLNNKIKGKVSKSKNLKKNSVKGKNKYVILIDKKYSKDNTDIVLTPSQ